MKWAVASSGDPARESSSEQDTRSSYLGAPVLAGSEVIGVIGVYADREEAFTEADMRLLQTLAASMGVALENARLFDRTAHLLKETEQRNAELAVINSIQQSVGAELDFQAIVDSSATSCARSSHRRHEHPLVGRSEPASCTPCIPTSMAYACRSLLQAGARDAAAPLPA